MQVLIEFIIGLVTLVVAAALAQVGVDLNTPVSNDREIRRVVDCPASRDAIEREVRQSC